MTNKVKDLGIDFKVNFDGAVGEIDPDAFKANLPEGLTEDTFEAVDSYRDQFAAVAGQQLLDHAEDYFQENDGDVTIADYSLGGQSTLSMNLSKDYQLVTAITISGNEALAAIESKAKDIYKETLAKDC